MPKYITNTAQFNPIDFATRIKPMETYVNTYNANRDAIDAVSLEGDTISGLLTNTEADKALRDSYNQFDTQATNAADALLNTGDVGAARKAVSTLSRYYKQYLEPIKAAAANRSKAISDFRTMQLNDKSYIGEDPSKYGVADYMNGNTPSTFGVKGSDLYAMAQNDAKAQSARRVLVGKYKLSPELLEQYFTRGIATGYSAREVGSVVLDDIIRNSNLSEKDRKELSDSMQYMVDAYNRVADTYGIDAFGKDSNEYKKSGNFIVNGILSGLSYDYKDDHLSNQGYLKPTTEGGGDFLSSISTPYDLVDTPEMNGKIKDEDIEIYKVFNEALTNPNALGRVLKTEEPETHIGMFGTPFKVGEKRDVTYYDALEDFISKHNIEGVTLSKEETTDPNGNTSTKYKLDGGEEALKNLAMALNSKVQLSRSKRFRNADENKRALSLINGRITAQQGTMLVTENGKDRTSSKDGKIQFKDGSQILLTPDGYFEVHTTDNKTYRLDDSVLGSSGERIVSWGGYNMSVPEALNYYRTLYNSVIEAESSDVPYSAESYIATNRMLGSLSDALMRSLDANVNSDPKVQSVTDSKLGSE